MVEANIDTNVTDIKLYPGDGQSIYNSIINGAQFTEKGNAFFGSEETGQIFIKYIPASTWEGIPSIYINDNAEGLSYKIRINP